MDLERSGAEFETTQWTLIEALREPAHPQHEQALQLLVMRYWPPVYAWFRRRRMNRMDAAEATQAFYATKVVKNRLFERVDSTRGGLRQLMLAALNNFAGDLASAARTAPVVALSAEMLEAEDALLARQEEADPDTAFDRRWSGLALEESMDRCRRHYEMAGRPDYWEAFRTRVLQPVVSGNSPPPLAQVAKGLGFADAAHAAVVVHTVKERCRLFLRQVIAESVRGPAEQEIEFMHRFLR